MRRNNLSVRTATHIGQRLPNDWEARVESFKLFLEENLDGVQQMHFGNIDEVSISFYIPGNKTVNLKGAKQVSLQLVIKNLILLLCCQ